MKLNIYLFNCIKLVIYFIIKTKMQGTTNQILVKSFHCHCVLYAFVSLSIMTEVSIYFIPSFPAGHSSHPFNPTCFGRPDKIVLGKESVKSINTTRGTELVA